jgi:NAD(P)-dependent dehydrogenase (short-subunit alcohol dehydrogenase family)
MTKTTREVFSMPSLARYPSLVDRVVLITGGSTGIGETLVEQFVAQGARVGFVDVDVPNAEALVRRLTPGAMPPPLFVRADVTDIAKLEAAIDTIREKLGPITVLLNNAANDQRHQIEATTPEYWDSAIAVNLKHQFFAARKVSADMKAAGGGSIVNFGSVSWKLKQGGMPVYTTAKSAVQGLTRSLARDFGPFNIRVNTIVPGWVMTEKQKRLWLDERGKEDKARGQCIDRDVMPIHIASMTLFLAADDSAMCTAQDFIVDGGWV